LKDIGTLAEEEQIEGEGFTREGATRGRRRKSERDTEGKLEL